METKINKTVLLSVDNNPSYLYLLPIVCKSWQLQGWKCYINYNNVYDKILHLICDTLDELGIINDGKYDTRQPTTQNKAIYAQCERMYMPINQNNEDYFIMSDADMFIASDFLNRDYDKVNAFGHDLTGYGQIPMCYVGMTGNKWKELMHPFDVEADLKKFAKKDAEDFYVAWGCDQDILTGRLRTVIGFQNVNFIKRGQDPYNEGLPMGRWDRHNWVKPAGVIHDCHLSPEGYTDGGTERLFAMCNDIYPNESWHWIKDYQTKFREIYGV